MYPVEGVYCRLVLTALATAIQTIIKRPRPKYGYLQDKQEKATIQAELLRQDWAA